MKTFRILFLTLLFFVSCDKFIENHYYDGIYQGGIWDVGGEWIIKGNEIIINNKLSGTTKVNCKQFDDRIEYTMPDGTVKILTVLENGNLKYSDMFMLEKVKDDEGIVPNANTKEDIKIHQIKNLK